MIDAGRVYSHANRQFISGIRDLALQSSRDDVIGVRTTVQHTHTQSTPWCLIPSEDVCPLCTNMLEVHQHSVVVDESEE